MFLDTLSSTICSFPCSLAVMTAISRYIAPRLEVDKAPGVLHISLLVCDGLLPGPHSSRVMCTAQDSKVEVKISQWFRKVSQQSEMKTNMPDISPSVLVSAGREVLNADVSVVSKASYKS